MSSAAAETLDRRAVPWLFATALATSLPQVAHQPPWLSTAAALLLAWGSWLWWRGKRLPGRWLLFVLVAAGCAGILLQYRTLFGRDAGVAMLLLFMAMKLLELRQRRDAYVVVNLGYFLLLTHYFHSQSVAVGLWLLGAMTVVTATLVRLHAGPAGTPWRTLRYAGLLVLQALPLMLILYLFFPRIAGPLWGLPQDAFAAKTGLSDRMAPGSIANLVRNSDIAFRVRFTGPLPDKNLLYWRGPVLEDYDGSTWRQRFFAGPAPAIEPLSPLLAYEITLEASDQPWLLALDAPTVLPPDARLAPDLSVTARQPVRQRLRYSLTSALSYRYNPAENAAALRRSLQLPPGSNPRTRALAEEWRRTDRSPERLVQRALALFRDRFSYTLQPPLLGPQPVDDFLFETRKGFCEHYASAFVVLMRAAGLPARVVTGYQGGEANPVDGYLVVRQSDAHAWAEVWLNGRGWVRVDPTAAVSPARVEAGLAASAAGAEALSPLFPLVDAAWLRNARYRWEALNNAWNQWVLGYNPQRQREFLSRLGVPDPDWRALTSLLVGAIALLLVPLTAWTLYRRPPVDPARRLWRRALGRLRRQQVRCEAWETPLAFAARLHGERPDLAPAVHQAAAAYCRARYGVSAADALAELRAAVARLP